MTFHPLVSGLKGKGVVFSLTTLTGDSHRLAYSLHRPIDRSSPEIAAGSSSPAPLSESFATLSHSMEKGMSSQIPTSNDRSRTYWTPVMDQFFIDLLLYHMHRGNRSGHTFHKQAWTDMLTAFNAKFRTQYDKDVLRSHYTTLWKQFYDIKNLLDQAGFSWDNTQQMVVADDYVWDAYIKAHPDAQVYRNRALMNFNDLYLIYAYTTADGRYSLSSHDIDFDVDFQGLNFGDGMDSLAHANNRHSYADWTLAMDEYFIELMLGHAKKGNQVNDTFKKQTWTDMVSFFNGKFCSQHSKTDLKHRHEKLRKYYSDLRILLEEDGFSWDENRQMLVADDDVWDSYIKAHPHAREYRKKTLLNYWDLGLIYGNSISKGVCGRLQQDEDTEDEGLRINGEEKNLGTLFGCEHAVAYWTVAMDCYFIDLLLDQMHSGNRIGHTFVTQDWIEMVTLFNAKFESHYGEDVLKDRCEHLKRQYNDVKILLEQRGFSWDESQQMVRAEDYVWDSYIKAHPGAESYRNHIVPSYHKLCIIYGPEGSDRRCNHLASNLDCIDEVPVLIADGEDILCHANNGLSKTDWTPSMDRYFIDLMLVQVRKGSKIHQKLNKQAWLDMVTSFNETFGSEHDKNMLRNRHESLGRLYHEMKNLIDQSGFSWDEVRQKVTAYDNVWDAYIKEHSEAKPFRTKKTPNFNDLSLIYGRPDGGFNGSEHNVNFHGNGSEFQESNLCGGSMTDWTPPMDRYFIDLLLEEVHKGGLIDCKFNKQAWIDMVAKFNTQFGPQHDREILKSRFKNLRRCFSEMKIILDQSGFAWDEKQQMVIADDNLWNAYIKENPDAAAYRSKTLPNYNDLFLIYGNLFTNEEDHHSGEDDDGSPASSNTSKVCANAEMEINSSSPEIQKDELLQSPARDIEKAVLRKRRCSSNPSNLSFSRKVQRTWQERVRPAIDEMADAISTYTTDEEDPNYGSSIESIVDALRVIPDMNDELFLDACKLLEDESKAKMFVALDITQRKAWLLRKLRL